MERFDNETREVSNEMPPEAISEYLVRRHKQYQFERIVDELLGVFFAHQISACS
jgi:hypothetical protein